MKLTLLLIPLLFLSSCTTNKEVSHEETLVDSGAIFVYAPTGESHICQLDASGSIPSTCGDQDLFLFHNAGGCLGLPEKIGTQITVRSQLFSNHLPESSLTSLSNNYYKNENYVFHERNVGGESCLHLVENVDAKKFQLYTTNIVGPTIGTQSGITYGIDGQNTYIQGATLTGILTEKEILKYLEDKVTQDTKDREIQ